jgi:hypothetical protein
MEMRRPWCRAPILPEFDVALGAQGAFLDQVALLPHEVFYCDGLVREYLPKLVSAWTNPKCSTNLQMIADQMSIFAIRTSDQNSAFMIPLLRQAMRRARLADLACKGQLIARDLLAIEPGLWRIRRRAWLCRRR